MNLYAVLGFAIFLLATQTLGANGNEEDKKNPCHLRALDRCYYPAFYFTHRPNTTGIAPTPEEFRLMCKTIKKVFKCMVKYFDECGTEMFSGLFTVVKEQILNSFEEMCKDGPMRDNFLKYSPCIHAKVKLDPEYKTVCVNNLQAGLELMTTKDNVEDMINTGCCSYNWWEDCINNMTVRHCGVNGDTAVTNLIDKASGGLIGVICKRSYFDPYNGFCPNYYPAPGTIAKGRHSNSILSKMFTFFCPNTGY